VVSGLIASLGNAQAPVDVLALQWLQQDTLVDLKTRVYLVEQCLGPVVLALEKVLREAEKRQAVGATRLPAGFNPINLLASHLMRNNPRFANFADASPYMASMRTVEQHLKDRIHSAIGDRRAHIHAEVQRRQDQFQQQQREKRLRVEARLEPLLAAFRNVDGVVALPSRQLLEAIVSFREVTAFATFPAERQALPTQLHRDAALDLLLPLVVDIDPETSARFCNHALQRLQAGTKPPLATATQTLAPQRSAGRYALLSVAFPSTIALFGSPFAPAPLDHHAD
jgi:hypothetical protein